MRKIVLIFLSLFLLLPLSEASMKQQTSNVVDTIQSLNNQRGVYPSEISTCKYCLRPEDAYYSCYKEICFLSAIPMSADEYRDRVYESAPLAEVKIIMDKYYDALKPLVAFKLHAEITQFEFLSKAIENHPQILSIDPNAIHDFKNIIKILKDLEQNQPKINSLLEMCAVKFAGDYFGLPTKEQMDLYKNNIQASKDDVLISVKPYLSESSYVTLRKNIQEAASYFPPTREEVLPMLKQIIQAELSKQKNSQFPTQNLNFKDPKTLQLEIRKIIATTDQPSLFLQKVLNLSCEELHYGHLRDMTDGENISLGWAGIQNPEAGKAVLYHELGHIISSHFYKGILSQESVRKFNSINRCLAEQNPADKKVSVDYIDNEQTKTSGLVSKFTEEDFADLVSAITGTKDNLNVGCFLFDTFNPGQQSMLTWPPNYNFAHSTSFYRLLHIQYVQKGKLPEKCLDYMDKVGDKKTFKNCWESATAEPTK